MTPYDATGPASPSAGPPQDRTPVDPQSAPHYTWGQGCDGWRLLADPALSVIEERMPPGTSEVRHLHRTARQFFYVVQGRLTLELGGKEHHLAQGQGIEVAPAVPHCVFNRATDDARFLVISNPATHNDRHPV
jgi:mannose-6-phosphate isomerase-like protein (cupin superfamily)